MRIRPFILITPVLAAAAFAAPANAVTFCVHQSTPCAPGTVDAGASIDVALDSAAEETDADRVEIGPGTYVGPFTYIGDGPLTVVGSGRDATRLEGAGGGTHSVLAAGEADISRLRVLVPAFDNWSGISAARNSRIHDVAVETTGTASARRGVSLRRSAALADASVKVAGDGAIAVDTHADGGTPTVADSTLAGPTGVYAFNEETGRTVVRRSSIDATLPLLVEGMVMEAENVVLRARGDGEAAAAVFCANTRKATLVADHLTIDGGGSSIGIHTACPVPGTTATVEVTNSIVDDVDFAYSRTGSAGGTANVSFAFSDLDPAPAGDSGPGKTSLSDNVDVDPGFGDDGLHLAAGSPLIDAGALGPAAQAFDRDRHARLVGERQDIGAFEFAPPPPPNPTAPTDAVAPAAPEATPPVVQASGGPPAVTDAALLAELRRTLAGRHGRRYRHRFLLPGTLRIKWVAKRRVVAQVRVKRTAAGVVRLRVKPTRAGRRLLRRGGRLKLRARASFATTGRATLRASRRAVLRRG